MTLLSATNLAKSFGAQDIFSGISLSIPPRARIGLVGANGVGKTTLLRILIGEESPSQGKVEHTRSLRIGYLPQESLQTSPHTLWQACLLPFHDLLDVKRKMEILGEELQDSPADEVLLERYGKLQGQFEHQGGYEYETRIRQVLSGLGFSSRDYERPLFHFSGGERTRALLAQLLLASPTLLVLDEPTNHLDIQAIEWLEGFLKDYPGGVLMVSHDRYLLDHVVRVIWEMTPVLEVFHGNYSAYLAQREERYTRRLKEYRAQEAFIEKEEEYIRRNIAGQNTRQAKGRLKRLERLLKDARLTPPADARKWKFRLGKASRSGDLVLRTSDLCIGFAGSSEPLFRVPDLTLRRGECAAILGPNGAGKTTFLRTLLGQVPPFQGEARLGASLQIGYFSQAREGLQPQRTLMQEIEVREPKMLPAEVRDYLARFLFTGDDVFQTVETLSGGEETRLALACLVLEGANLLLLDEPTNHLDLPSQEALQRNLQEFSGTILLVTHDRYLVDAVATQIWQVDSSSKMLTVFPGNYSQFHQAQWVEHEREKPKAHPGVKSSNVEKPRVSKNRIATLESDINLLEGRLNDLTTQLENIHLSSEEVAELGTRYMELQHSLDEKWQEWDKIISSE